MSLSVRGDRVIVQVEHQAEYQTASGVLVVEDEAPPVIGTVIAIGDVQDVKPDDVVIFPPSAGQAWTFEDVPYLVLRESDILAVVE